MLLRAAEPIDGVDVMRARRGRESVRELCSGPAKLCQAFGVDRSFDGADLVRGHDLWIAEGTPVPKARIVAGPRVGIRVGTEYAWRFSVADDPFVSRGRPTTATGSATTHPSTP